MKQKAWRTVTTRRWRTLAIWSVLVGAATLLFTWKLASLPGGVSPQELAYISSADSGRELIQSPAFLFHKICTYTLVKLGAHHIVFFRLVSVVFGFAAVSGLYFILGRWYSKRVALLGSLLFASSTIVLHAVRSATPEVSYLLLASVIAVGLSLQSSKHHKKALFVLIASLCLTPYIPGFIWLSVAVCVWQGRRIIRAVSRSPLWLKLLCGASIILLLAPAIMAVWSQPREIFAVAGLPTHSESALFYLRRIPSTLSALIWRYNDGTASQWASSTAIFDVFTLAMAVLGIYSLRYEHRLMRGRLQAGLTALLFTMIVAGGAVGFVALAPIVYLLVAGGIAFMLQQWFTVFPKNPVARGLAVGLLCVSVGMCSYYHIYRYFVAWPYTNQAKTEFQQSYLVK